MNDYVNCGNGASLVDADHMTISVLVKFKKLGLQGVVAKAQDGPNMGYWLGMDEDNRMAFVIRNDLGGGQNHIPGNVLDTDKWYFLAVTFNGAQVYLYENGIQVTSYTKSVTSSLLGNLKIGTGTDWIGGSWFDGTIDEVRVYNYALTPTQIKTLYNENSAVRFGPLTGSP